MTQPTAGEPIFFATRVHLLLADGRAFSVSATQVRLGAATIVRSMLSDVASGHCSTSVVGDASAPAALRHQSNARHPLVVRALDEVLAAGHLPYPDTIAADTSSRIRKHASGVELHLAFPDVRCDLTLAPRRAPIGDWIPRCDVAGTIVVDGVSHAARGVATAFEGAETDRAVIHLDDIDIHVWREGNATRAIIARGDGFEEHEATLEPIATWTSIYTFHDFGEAWRLAIPRASLELELRATFADQELATMTTRAPRWHGRCEVHGVVDGRSAGGVAYLEHDALDASESMSDFFAAIPRETARALENELPLPLTYERLLAIVGGHYERYVRDVDLDELRRILIEPIREILDRKGKAWRSYAAVMCFYAMRGDKHRRDVVELLLALAEVIHVGTLIVDDVEDASPTRRGGPACHVTHGVPLAINAGSFCYFVWQAWLERLALPAGDKLRIYEIYFDFMRVGHLGQALDIQGFTPGMAAEIVETGDVALLTRQLMNVYVLKTGAPASVFARIGAIVAGGGEAQVKAIADLFEALGISFQIMDDVQNLKGFIGDPKHCEDLTGAKITMPLLEAMRVLDRPARRDLWDRIGRCASEPALVPSIVDTIDRCGAFTACREHAHALLEDAWRAAAPLLDDSIAKVMLRSFCFYVVECLGG